MKKTKFMKFAILVSSAIAGYGLFGQNVIPKDSDLNLIENGGFEQERSGWDFTPGSVNNDFNTYTEGKQSLKIDGSGKASFIYGSQFIVVKLKPSTEYVFSVDMKRSSSKGRVMASVVEKAKINQPDWVYHTCVLSGEILDKWEHFSIKFKTENAIANAAVMLYNASSEGLAWFDNVKLVEVNK